MYYLELKRKSFLTALPNPLFLHLYLKTVHKHWPFLIKLSLFESIHHALLTKMLFRWDPICMAENLKTIYSSDQESIRTATKPLSCAVSLSKLSCRAPQRSPISRSALPLCHLTLHIWGIKTSPPASHPHLSATVSCCLPLTLAVAMGCRSTMTN